MSETRRPRLPNAAWALSLLASLCVPAQALCQNAPAALPASIPLFPLPDVALFPSSTQPFYIYEPRYRTMVADALQGDSIIGMVVLRPGFEERYEGSPPIYEVGCAGVIVSSEALGDGRYNILLRGLVKFRVLSEDRSRTYRVARVEEIPERVEGEARTALSARRRQLEDALRAAYPGSEPPPDYADEELIDALSLMLPIEPAQRQELLEADGPIERARLLIGLLARGGRSSV